MAVLSVVGTMHLVRMAVIAAFVLTEKIAPAFYDSRFAAAVALVGWGRADPVERGDVAAIVCRDGSADWSRA